MAIEMRVTLPNKEYTFTVGLPRYEIPDEDIDLWGCGKNLTRDSTRFIKCMNPKCTKEFIDWAFNKRLFCSDECKELLTKERRRKRSKRERELEDLKCPEHLKGESHRTRTLIGAPKWAWVFCRRNACPKIFAPGKGVGDYCSDECMQLGGPITIT